jgi:hypothetical protein
MSYTRTILTGDKTNNTKDSFHEELDRVFDQFRKYHMKILLRYLYGKVGNEDFFKPTIGNKCLHAISDDNGFKAVNFAATKNLIVKSTIFRNSNIHKSTYRFPDGKIHFQIGHILVDGRRNSSVLDVQSLIRGYCDTDHCPLVVKLGTECW